MRRDGRTTVAARSIVIALALLSLGAHGPVGAEALWDADGADALAKRILQRGGVNRGICCLPRSSDGKLAVAIANASELLVHAQVASDEAVAAARKLADGEGFLGGRVYVDKAAGAQIVLADNYADLVVIPELDEKARKALPAAEVFRVLCPNGKVMARIPSNAFPVERTSVEGWLSEGGFQAPVFTEGAGESWVESAKPFPKGIDDWSHWFHGPDNNMVSTDTVAKWPFIIQWMGLPMFSPTIRIVVAAGGRIFNATGSTGNLSSEDANRIRAYNAFNGQLLWERLLSDEYHDTVNRSAFVATDKAYYLVDGNTVLSLDPQTGREQRRIEFDGIKGTINWLAMDRGILYVMAGDKKYPIANAGDDEWYPIGPRGRMVVTGKGEDELLWGFGKRIAAYDLVSNKTLWTHEESALLDYLLIGLSDGKLFFHALKSRVACLDAQTGELLWENASPEIIKAIDGNPFACNIKGEKGMLCTPKEILVMTLDRKFTVAVSAADGTMLWKKPINLGIVDTLWLDDKLYLKGYGDNRLLDPMTGESIGRYQGPTSPGCGPITASPTGFFARHGMGWDRLRNAPVFDKSWRTGCVQNAIVANGLVIGTPFRCTCSYSIRGFNVLAPAGDFKFNQLAKESERLESFPGADTVAGIKIGPLDWPTYRGNNRRNGSSDASVPASGELLWEFRPKRACETTPPIAAGGFVFLGADDGRLVCVDGVSGNVRWEFLTGGRILSSPTVWEDRVYIGSSDGYAYALEAATGRELWRFRAAPVSRRIMVYGYLSSTWPVNTGILLENGVAYLAAGIVDREGTHVFALDGRTGRIKWQNNESGRVQMDTGVSALGHLMVFRNHLWMAPGSLLTPAAYSLATGRYSVPSNLGAIWKTSMMGVQANLLPRGSELGVFRDRFLLHGGLPLYSEPKDRLKANTHVKFMPECGFVFAECDDAGAAGTVKMPEIAPTFGGLPCAWDDSILLTALSGFRQLECWDGEKTAAFLTEEYARNKKRIDTAPIPDYQRAIEKVAVVRPDAYKWKPEKSVRPMCLWGPVDYDMYGLALAKNAVLVAHVKMQEGRPPEYSLAALDRRKGELLWECLLPGEPMLNGLCVDRRGRVIAALTDGVVVACGGPEP